MFLAVRGVPFGDCESEDGLNALDRRRRCRRCQSSRAPNPTVALPLPKQPEFVRAEMRGRSVMLASSSCGDQVPIAKRPAECPPATSASP